VPESDNACAVRLVAGSVGGGERRAFLVSTDGHACEAGEVLQPGHEADDADPFLAPTGACGAAVERWLALGADERRWEARLPATGAALAPEVRAKPIDPFAKVIVVGGRRERPMLEGSPPRVTGFLKFPTAFAEPDAPILLPQGGRFEIDAALGFVIGRRATRIATGEAAAIVAGYMLLADVTDVEAYEEEARTNNALLGKNRPGLSPVAPAVLLTDGALAVAELEIVLRVNGETRQRFTASDLLWSPAEAIAAWSVTVLLPGDVVALGGGALRHPSRVTIVPGDIVEIDGGPLGTIRTEVGLSRGRSSR
jgi:2-keto-4-pentenoate hydratase/2-oxohepta-3-ene-1,7-dioic acid hydratase in catechol pathway